MLPSGFDLDSNTVLVLILTDREKTHITILNYIQRYYLYLLFVIIHNLYLSTSKLSLAMVGTKKKMRPSFRISSLVVPVPS